MEVVSVSGEFTDVLGVLGNKLFLDEVDGLQNNCQLVNI